ncbi:MAG: CcmD family protein [Polyangiaceae bacterium]|nr:CcmD family protein [Polyangiaceae bacterium]
MQSTQSSASVPTDRATEFRPVEGGPNTTSAEALLIAAYFVLWALLFRFVLVSHRRQQVLTVRLDELERRLETNARSEP